MPQKALTSKNKKPEKLGKKGPRVNANHKKAIQKKGRLVFKSKPTSACRATQSGGKMLVVKPPPDAEVEIRGPKPKKNPKQAPVVKVPYRF